MKVATGRSTGVRLASVGLVLMLTACDRESVNPTESGSDLGPALETSQAVVPGPGERVRVDVIFRGKPPASLADEEVLSEVGASVVYRYRLIRGLTIDIPEEAIPALELKPAVVKVGRPGATFPPTGDAKSWEKLNPKYGHDFDDPIVDPSSGAKIVVAGTGIQCNNSDLDCTGGRSFAADGSPWDQDGAGGNGHETGVASIIAAEHNGVGRFGWAAGAFLYSGRVHDKT